MSCLSIGRQVFSSLVSMRRTLAGSSTQSCSVLFFTNVSMQRRLCRTTLVLSTNAIDLMQRLQPSYRWPWYVLSFAAILSHPLVCYFQPGDGPKAALTSPEQDKSTTSQMPHRTCMDAVIAVLNRAYLQLYIVNWQSCLHMHACYTNHFITSNERALVHALATLL